MKHSSPYQNKEAVCYPSSSIKTNGRVPALASRLCLCAHVQGKTQNQAKKIDYFQTCKWSVFSQIGREYFLNDGKYRSAPYYAYCPLVPGKHDFSSSAISRGLDNWHK